MPSLYRLSVLLLREDGAVIGSRYLVITDVFNNHRSFLFLDYADCLSYKFFRVVSEHIQLGLADTFQDSYNRATCQRRAFGYLAHKVVLHG